MSFPAYSDYQDSGIEWLGEVPSHWKLRKIKHVATFAGGSTPSRDDPSFWNGDIPWVSPKDMKSETITGSEERITERGLSQMAGGLISPGAVLLVVRSGILRHTVPVAITGVPVALNQDIKALRFDSAECAPSFFFRWVQGLNDSLTLAWMKQGATVESLEHQFLAETILPLPPISEQALISIFLDRETAKIDALIEEQRRLIALLKEKRQAAISHAVTKGLDPHAPMKDSGIEWLGKVPAHWEVRRIKHVARMESGHTPDRKVQAYWEDCDIPWVSLHDTGYLKDHDYISETAQMVNALGIANSSARILPPGIVVFSRDATIGRCAITTRPMAVSQHFIAWVCGSALSAEFLLFCLRSMAGELDRLSAGATLKTIGMPDVRTLAIAMPPLSEQHEIVTHARSEAERIDALIVHVTEASRLLQERRAALISAAVTGKIDVRGKAQVLPFPIDRARARGLVATEIMERSAHQATFGRVKFQKIAFLAEAHVGISELAGSYTREAAGPLDRALIEEMETGAWSIAGIKHEQLGGAGTTVNYRLGQQQGAHRRELEQWLGEDRTAKLDKLIGDFAALSTKEAEAVATLYGVWNDALSEGTSPTDDEIINGFLNDWHPEKRAKFRASELPEWLGWMHRHGILPTGLGPKTTTGRLFV